MQKINIEDKYRKLSEEDKNKMRVYGKNRYHNMSEEKKQKLKEYQKNIIRQKILNIIMKKIVFFNVNLIVYVPFKQIDKDKILLMHD